jgi:hypothetical protein
MDTNFALEHPLLFMLGAVVFLILYCGAIALGIGGASMQDVKAWFARTDKGSALKRIFLVATLPAWIVLPFLGGLASSVRVIARSVWLGVVTWLDAYRRS